MKNWGSLLSKGFVLGLFLYSSLAISAIRTIEVEVKESKSAGPWKLAAGTKLKIQTKNGPADALFLSEVVDPQSSTHHFMFLDLNRSRVYWAKESDVRWKLNGVRKNLENQLQPAINPYEQIGGTCAAYGMFHYFLQKKLSGTGSSKIEGSLNSEQERTQLLATAIDEYYIERPGRASLANVHKRIGENFNLKCRQHQVSSLDRAIKLIQDKLQNANPLFVGFNLGPDMVTSSYPVYDYQDLSAYDDRLWVPRQRGQRNIGGHTVVLSAYFELNGLPYAVVIDSNWEEPRVWDISKYLNQTTALKEVEFYSCD